MSDVDDAEFDSADAGAADCIPKQAGEIRKGAYAMLKGHPCKVVDYSTSKTGKHGHAKAHIIGIDIFTGKKHEDLCPTSHNMSVPNVNKDEYTVMDVADDGQLSLLTAAGDTKDDLNLPDGTDDSKAIAKEIQEKFAAGKTLIVTVMSAVGQEMICAVKEDNA
jgi:translation initiation factor 5A